MAEPAPEKRDQSNLDALKKRFSGVQTSPWRYGIELKTREPEEWGHAGRLSQVLNKELDLIRRKAMPMVRQDTKLSEQVLDVFNVAMDDFGRRQSVPHTKYTVAHYETTGPGKAKCSLCNLYFSAESVVGTCCNKYVLQFRMDRGERVEGRRFQTASFLYSRARLCVFCAQLLGHHHAADKSRLSTETPETTESTDVSICTAIDSMTTENSRLQTTRRHSQPTKNAALSRPAWQSSTVGTQKATLAVDGNDAAGHETSSCTRREFEAWWECDLGDAVRLARVVVRPYSRHSRKRDSFSAYGEHNDVVVGRRPHDITPVYIMLTNAPLGRTTLNNARKVAAYSILVTEHLLEEQPIVCDLPPGVRASCVRIQVKDTRALRLVQVLVERAATCGSAVVSDDAPPMSLWSSTQRRPHTVAAATTSKVFEGHGNNALCSEKLSKESRPRTSSSNLVELRSPVRPQTRAGYYRAETREVVVRETQPSDVALSRVRCSKTLGLASFGLRRSKTPARDFDAYPVDQIYWRTVLRYEIREDALATHEAIVSTFSAKQLAWARTLFALCRAQTEPQPSEWLMQPSVIRELNKGILHGVVETSHFSIVAEGGLHSSSCVEPPASNAVAASPDSTAKLSSSSCYRDDSPVSEDCERQAESGLAELSSVYACLRKLSESLVSLEAGSACDRCGAGAPMDASSAASVAHDICRLAGFDERDSSLREFKTNFSEGGTTPSASPKRKSAYTSSDPQCESSTSATDLGLVPQADVEIPLRRTKSHVHEIPNNAGVQHPKGSGALASMDLSMAEVLPLRLGVSWRQFVALLGVVRARTMGDRRPDDLIGALALENDDAEINPAAAQRRRDRRLAEPAAKPQCNSQKRVDAMIDLCGSPTISLQSCNKQPALPRLITAESRFRFVAGRNAPGIERAPTGNEYCQNAERRKKRQRELSLKTARVSRRAEFKSCGLCLIKFHVDKFANTVVRKLIVAFLRRRGLGVRDTFIASHPSTIFSKRLPICNFCAQFFDCDQPDGLAIEKRRESVPGNEAFEPFFDLRYPNRTECKPVEFTTLNTNARRVQDTMHYRDRSSAECRVSVDLNT